MRLIPINKKLIELVENIPLEEFLKEFTQDNLRDLLDMRLIELENNTIILSELGEQFKENYKEIND